jgi:hypothetical protein
MSPDSSCQAIESQYALGDLGFGERQGHVSYVALPDASILTILSPSTAKFTEPGGAARK